MEMQRFGILLLVAALAAPLHGREKVTAQQLEQAVYEARGKQDKDAARQLQELKLTERLSNARLARLQAELPGEKSRQALLAVADDSMFLGLPAADRLSIAEPDTATQGRILRSAVEFVAATLSKMPDFFATQTTTRFQNMNIESLSSGAPGPVIVANHAFLLLDKSTATVTYVNGREVQEIGKKRKVLNAAENQQGLTNWGIFGPMLGVVMSDVLHGKAGWSHWEQGPTGPLAVFRYVVPEDTSHYTVSYCCVWMSGGRTRPFQTTPAYHGEIAVDPKTGDVLRLVVETDLKRGLPISEADVAVDYGPVEIGGKTYICPVKSVSISKTRALGPNMYIVYDPKAAPPKALAGKKPKEPQESARLPLVTAVNDITFADYHVFRSEIRILPADGAEPSATPQQ
ncbi:MAG: hypothetical protein WBD67_05645 [Terracidiphilus sp.]